MQLRNERINAAVLGERARIYVLEDLIDREKRAALPERNKEENPNLHIYQPSPR